MIQNSKKCRLLTSLIFVGPMLLGCRSGGGLVANQLAENTTRLVSPLVLADHELSSTTTSASQGDLVLGPQIDSEVRNSPTFATPSNGEAIEETADDPPQLPTGAFDDTAVLSSQSQTAVAIVSKEASQALSPSTIDDSPSTDKRFVQLVVTGFRPGIGEVKIAIFTDAKTFPQPEGASEVLSLKPEGAMLELPIQTEQTIAVAVYQDINGDGVLSRNRLGIPLEPFAFSNKAMGKRGPPTFDEARIHVSHPTAAPTVVPIKLP